MLIDWSGSVVETAELSIHYVRAGSGAPVVFLHGGPGGTHEYFEAFDSYFPGAGVEYYFYDQLGSFDPGFIGRQQREWEPFVVCETVDCEPMPEP